MACKYPTNNLIAPKHEQQQTKHRIPQTNAQNSRTLETVKIAQLNGQNSRSLIDEIRVYMAKMSINAIALQEPSNSNGVIRRVGVTTKVILGIKAFTGSVKYRSQKLAIAVRNPEIKCHSILLRQCLYAILGFDMLLPTDVIENCRDSSRERNSNMY